MKHDFAHTFSHFLSHFPVVSSITDFVFGTKFLGPVDQTGKSIFATLCLQLGEYEVAYVTGQVGETKDKVLPLLPRRQSGEGDGHRQSVFVGDLKLSEFRGMLKHHNVEVGDPQHIFLSKTRIFMQHLCPSLTLNLTIN